eukprot:SM000224S07096  [mRNA]  locus=s224:129849:130808:+ [translate_table: standard]
MAGGGGTAVVVTKETASSLDVVRWAAANAAAPGEALTLLHVVDRVPCRDGFEADVRPSEAGAAAVAAHVRHVITPYLHQLKAICDAVLGVPVDLKVAVADCAGAGIAAAAAQLGAAALVLGKTPLALSRPRDFLARGMRELATRGLGERALHVLRHRPEACAVFVVQRGRLLCHADAGSQQLHHHAAGHGHSSRTPSPPISRTSSMASSTSSGDEATPEGSPPQSSLPVLPYFKAKGSLWRSRSLDAAGLHPRPPPPPLVLARQGSSQCASDEDLDDAEQMASPLFQALRRTIELRKTITTTGAARNSHRVLPDNVAAA